MEYKSKIILSRPRTTRYLRVSATHGPPPQEVPSPFAVTKKPGDSGSDDEQYLTISTSKLFF